MHSINKRHDSPAGSDVPAESRRGADQDDIRDLTNGPMSADSNGQLGTPEQIIASGWFQETLKGQFAAAEREIQRLFEKINVTAGEFVSEQQTLADFLDQVEELAEEVQVSLREFNRGFVTLADRFSDSPDSAIQGVAGELAHRGRKAFTDLGSTFCGDGEGSYSLLGYLLQLKTAAEKDSESVQQVQERWDVKDLLKRGGIEQSEFQRVLFAATVLYSSSQAEAVGKGLEQGWAAMPELVSGLTSSGLSNRIVDAGIRLMVLVDAEAKATLLPRRLIGIGARVIEPLVDNAFEAIIDEKSGMAPSEGQICVEISKSGEELTVQVRDNGPGIPEELRERVFSESFSTKPRGSGVGLGLVQGYVRSQHDDWNMSLELEPADASCPGATFTLRTMLE